jgi:hypothetical protein
MRCAALVIAAVEGLLSGAAAAQASRAQSPTSKAYREEDRAFPARQSARPKAMAHAAGPANKSVSNTSFLHGRKTAQLRLASLLPATKMMCNQAHSRRVMTNNGGLSALPALEIARPALATSIDYAAQANWGIALAILKSTGGASERCRTRMALMSSMKPSLFSS